MRDLKATKPPTTNGIPVQSSISHDCSTEQSDVFASLPQTLLASPVLDHDSNPIHRNTDSEEVNYTTTSDLLNPCLSVEPDLNSAAAAAPILSPSAEALDIALLSPAAISDHTTTTLPFDHITAHDQSTTVSLGLSEEQLRPSVTVTLAPTEIITQSVAPLMPVSSSLMIRIPKRSGEKVCDEGNKKSTKRQKENIPPTEVERTKKAKMTKKKKTK